MGNEGATAIRVLFTTKKRFEKYYLHPRSTADEVLNRLMDAVPVPKKG